MIPPAVATWAEPDGASWAKLEEWPEVLEAGRFKIVSDLKRRPDATRAAPDGATWPEAKEGGPDWAEPEATTRPEAEPEAEEGGPEPTKAPFFLETALSIKVHASFNMA
jgi:hypothetical protein